MGRLQRHLPSSDGHLIRRFRASQPRLIRGSGLSSCPSSLLPAAALTLIAAFALYLRLAGMAADQPYVYYPDEWAFAKPAMQILVSGDPNPHVFIYPTLLTYAETGVAALVHAATDASLDAGLPPFQVGGMRNMSVSDFLPSQYPYVMWGRMLVGIFGVLTVVLVGLGGRVAINRRLQDVEAQDATPREGTLEGEASAPAPRSADTRPAAGAAGTGTSWLAGITGAAFMALAVLPLVFSRLLTTDVPSAFFAAATLVASLAARARPSDRKSDLLLMAAGLCTGLAASTKYNAIVVAIVPAIGYLTRAGSLRTLPAFLVASVRSRTPYLVVLAAVAGFVLATPMVLFDFQSVVGGIRETILLYNVLGHVGAEGNAAGFYVNYLWTVGFGPVLCVLSVAGIAWAIIRHRATDLALVVFPLLYFVLVSLPLVRYERNLLPLVPFVALLAGRFVADTLSALRVRLARRSPIAGVATVALLLAALAVQPVAAAAGNAQTASLPDTRSIALAWVDAHLPAGSTIVREAYTPQVSPNRYRVGYTVSLAAHGLDWYHAHGFRYAIASSLLYSRYLNAAHPVERSFYLTLFADHTVFRIAPSSDASGPALQIVDLDPTP